MILVKIRKYQNIQDIYPIISLSASNSNIILDHTPQSAKKFVDQKMIFSSQILTDKKINPKYLFWFIKELMPLLHSWQIVEDDFKSTQNHITTKAERQKLNETVAKNCMVITLVDIRVSFQARGKSKLQKAINLLQKQKDLEHKKELGRLKKFWDVLKQHHVKWGKKQAQTHVAILKNYTEDWAKSLYNPLAISSRH